MGEPDHILAIGAAVAEELYGVQVPVVVLGAEDLARLPDGVTVRLEGDRVEIG
jgi:predicted aconitase with swiveling domain